MQPYMILLNLLPHTSLSGMCGNQWDLVCERRYLYSSSQAAVFIGSLFASLLASLLLNRYCITCYDLTTFC